MRRGRWAGSAWAFVRRGSGASLAPSPTLGGSQAGARIAYRINDDPQRPLALVARAYTPLDEPGAAEVAAGVEWRPSARLPITVAVERREAIGDAARSAFSVLAYGGVSDRRVTGPVLLDAYGQAGIVGFRSRDLFADGSVRLGVAIHPRVKLGVGAWAAAQPSASRADIGPQVAIRVPVGDVSVGIAADWRFRVAGDARPASGPAVTLYTDF